MFKKSVLACAVLLSLVFSANVFAAECLVGTYYFGEDDMNLAVIVKDKANARIDIMESEDGGVDIFMLITQGKKWVIGRDDNESSWEAIDFDAAMKIFAEQNKIPDLSAKAQIEKTGPKDVNGFKGEAFDIKYPYHDFEGEFEEFEMVLSDNSDVATITNVLAIFVKDIDEEDFFMAVKSLERISQENGKTYGVLQYDDMELKSIAKAKYDDSYFTVPADAEILDMAELMGEDY